MPIEHWFLIGQMAAMWGLFSWYYSFLGGKVGRSPIYEPAILWPLILLLYSTVPVITWLVEGGEYPFYYGRMALLDPDARTHIEILSVALAYILSFLVGNYFFLNKTIIVKNETPSLIPENIFHIAIFFYLFSVAFEFILKAGGLIRASADYADAYLAVAELPAGIGQIYKISGALGNFCVGIIIIAAMQDLKKYKWIVYGYLVTLLLSYDVGGHRSGIATGLFRIFLCWHLIVRPFSNKFIIVAGILSLLIFNTLGFYRGLMEGADGQFSLGVSEFLMVYANAIEMIQHVRDGNVDLPFGIRFAEFYSFLPSQLIDTGKTSLDNWFAETYHSTYFNSGGGLAFGALPQAIVGGGIYEAILRGIALGWFYALLSNMVRKRPDLWWLFPVQLYFLVYLYYSVRSSSFSFLGSVFQVLIPSLLILHLAGLVFTARKTAVETSKGQV
jgi:hypothetical protein